MDFDDVDNLEPSFEALVSEARQELLSGSSVETQWPALVEKHDFFKDMVKEAKARGQLIGSLLVAAVGITKAIESHTDATSAAACDHEEARVLVALAHLYDELYTTSPVPSASAWCEAVVGAFHHSATDLRSAFDVCTDQASTTPSLPYLSSAARVVRGEQVPQALDGDDGSFAENELKAFLRRCQQLGRKCTRGDGGGSTNLKAMLAVISDYLSHSTLEW